MKELLKDPSLKSVPKNIKTQHKIISHMKIVTKSANSFLRTYETGTEAFRANLHDMKLKLEYGAFRFDLNNEIDEKVKLF
jgi:hypothetical protein